MSELPSIELDDLALADDLVSAVRAGKPFVITDNYEKAAVVVPYATMTAIARALEPVFKSTVHTLAQIFGIPLA